MRRHNSATAALNKAWWSELVAHSVRDQLSLPYVLWGMRDAAPKVAILQGCTAVSPYFTARLHW